MKAERSFLLPLLLVFIFCNGLFLTLKFPLARLGIDNYILIIANSLFLIIAIITSLIQKKALQNTNPNVFIRSVMAGMMIKMFVCIIAIIIYWFISKQNFSTATVFAAMLVYLIYLVVEVSLVTKMNKHKHA